MQEIKKDRDDRLERLRIELEDISHKYDLLERDHTALKVAHDQTVDERTLYRHNFENVSKQLEQAIKVKVEKEDLLNEKIR